jgi:dienelactone hydrolase
MAMEYDATGERADRPDFETGINNVTSLGQLLGINNVGFRVMSNLAALRYLKSREDVDPNRIGITGLCQGAIVTWFTSALCEEFKAVAPLCGATTYEAIALEYANRQGGWSGTSPYVFKMLEFADFQHIAAVIAPRPLFVQNNLIDIHWPLSGYEKVKQMAAQVYALYGAEDKCRFSLENGPHAFAEPFLSNIADWFSEAL